jgi:hypothetical protein
MRISPRSPRLSPRIQTSGNQPIGTFQSTPTVEQILGSPQDGEGTSTQIQQSGDATGPTTPHPNPLQLVGSALRFLGSHATINIGEQAQTVYSSSRLQHLGRQAENTAKRVDEILNEIGQFRETMLTKISENVNEAELVKQMHGLLQSLLVIELARGSDRQFLGEIRDILQQNLPLKTHLQEIVLKFDAEIDNIDELNVSQLYDKIIDLKIKKLTTDLNTEILNLGTQIRNNQIEYGTALGQELILGFTRDREELTDRMNVYQTNMQALAGSVSAIQARLENVRNEMQTNNILNYQTEQDFNNLVRSFQNTHELINAQYALIQTALNDIRENNEINFRTLGYDVMNMEFELTRNFTELGDSQQSLFRQISAELHFYLRNLAVTNQYREERIIGTIRQEINSLRPQTPENINDEIAGAAVPVLAAGMTVAVQAQPNVPEGEGGMPIPMPAGQGPMILGRNESDDSAIENVSSYLTSGVKWTPLGLHWNQYRHRLLSDISLGVGIRNGMPGVSIEFTNEVRIAPHIISCHVENGIGRHQKLSIFANKNQAEFEWGKTDGQDYSKFEITRNLFSDWNKVSLGFYSPHTTVNEIFGGQKSPFVGVGIHAERGIGPQWCHMGTQGKVFGMFHLPPNKYEINTIDVRPLSTENDPVTQRALTNLQNQVLKLTKVYETLKGSFEHQTKSYEKQTNLLTQHTKNLEKLNSYNLQLSPQIEKIQKTGQKIETKVDECCSKMQQQPTNSDRISPDISISPVMLAVFNDIVIYSCVGVMCGAIYIIISYAEKNLRHPFLKGVCFLVKRTMVIFFPFVFLLGTANVLSNIYWKMDFYTKWPIFKILGDSKIPKTIEQTLPTQGILVTGASTIYNLLPWMSGGYLAIIFVKTVGFRSPLPILKFVVTFFAFSMSIRFFYQWLWTDPDA